MQTDDTAEPEAYRHEELLEAQHLPGPKTAVLDCTVPCAPIQTPHTRIDLLWETRRARNRGGLARTGVLGRELVGRRAACSVKMVDQCCRERQGIIMGQNGSQWDVMGRGHASLSTDLDTCHSKP